MSAEQINSQYPAEYAKVEALLPGQSVSWLKTLREQALAFFSSHGFPSLREEEWRYTNVSAIEKKLFSPVVHDEIGALDVGSLDTYRLENAWTIVLVDGHFSAALSDLEGLPSSVRVLDMASALEQYPDELQKYFTQAVSYKQHGFVAFNAAWFTDGVFIHVPSKEVLSKPVQIIHVVTQADYMSNTRHIITIDKMAQAEVIETFIGCDDAYLSTAVTEVFVGENADLTLYKLQLEGEKAYHFAGTYVKQEANARFKHHNFAFGGLLARNDIRTDLGRASECELNGLYLGIKRQHIDNHTRINHLQPHAISRELYKGVLDQRARGVFQGRVVVAEYAQKTSSEMNNRNLLLSNDAEADTKPQLEIYADDVKCAHGVTVGQLDEKSIFYLQSRCVDEATARNMLTFAFANEMVFKIKIKNLHDQILEQLLARFPQEGIQQEWL
ncbi:Fe-S cluster assembly protein SufD [methanotrophic endosymbiont of Bathymodiolus puteoserpentis (Logatchev)]|jgi:Fe-S cluster assembly protein SufD|uniref:Fe-S cluster assembly protein SufD n=1 Tax=methanotrophic endosymbiont of Bathymodiolus puteoserpentis (Logatchev) TaxID=343235 RepID=UPI0013C6DFB4|nr:Fe-S cluster assembly protein SufD [methanotrophic endosymbiont of Bathymodiolus puteoserpentis (Logatchev)]SHE22311.1 Iron-sulfur cluster assembly protein SufD [methanotrophic endosymbiont of Bathymodiolus puteoserpentis (Logatchev)]